MKKVLAFDMGATSIRGLLGWVENNRLVTEEVMRMSHQIVEKDNRLRWQWNRILERITQTILEHQEEIASVGVDTWGVDFGILDQNGELLFPPISYRDEKHGLGYEKALEKLCREEIFLHTGNQIMPINTVFQLEALGELSPELLHRADKILMLPDLLYYMLSGEIIAEESIWSTTGLLDRGKKALSEEIFHALDFKKEWMPPLIHSGKKTGSLKHSKIPALQGLDIQVTAVCGHDTASAVLLTDAYYDPDSMFLSCGTWSLIGSVVDGCRISEKVLEKDLTNELGFDSRAMLFKNITGLYLLEKYKQQLEEKLGRGIDFKEITEYVQSTREKVSHIDMEDPAFGAEGLDAKGEIDKYLSDRGLALPSGDFDYFTLIYESLVEKYRQVKEMVQEVLGKKFSKMHIIGGGARSRLLCGMICDKLEVTVKAGPAEASALGNIILQLYALGEIQEVSQGVKLALENEIIQYPPMPGGSTVV